MMQLHPADYAVFGILLLVSALVGPYYMWRDRHKESTSESYFVANRGLHVIPTAASLFASFWSAIALVGIPAELYTGGARFFMTSVGQAIGITIASFIAVPMVYRLKLISTFEYFELRFKSKLLRKIGTIANIFGTAFYLAVVTYSPCIALEAVSPIPVWASVIATASITMIYTVLGGIKAVVLVDLIQAIVMLGGVFAGVIVGYSKIEGGFSRAMEIASEGGRLNFFDFNPDPTNTYNFWAMAIPPIFADAGLYATSQAAVQRYSALPTVTQATWSVWSLAPQIMALKISLFFLAMAMFAHYDAQGCDPLKGGIIKSPNQLTTFYIADVLNYPGLVGLWFSALFSGSLSTMSTGYNSVAATIWEDLLKDRLRHRLTPVQESRILKLISFLLGVFTCCLAIGFNYLPSGGSVVKLYSLTTSMFGSAVYIAFFTGTLLPFVNAPATIIGMVFSTLGIFFLSSGQLFFKISSPGATLPYKTANCSAMIAQLFASGRFRIPLQQATSLSNFTKTSTAAIVLLTNNVTMMSSFGNSSFTDPEISLNNVFSNQSLELAKSNQTFFTDDSNLPKGFKWLFSISYFVFPLLSLIIGVVVAILVSFCSGGWKVAKYVHPRYLIVKNCFVKAGIKENDSNFFGDVKQPLPSVKSGDLLTQTASTPSFGVVNKGADIIEETEL